MLIGFLFDDIESYQASAGDAADETAELSYPDEIDAIIAAIESLGHQVKRIGDMNGLLKEISKGISVDLFFNYAIGKHGKTREAQIPALLEGLKIPYTGADSFSLALAADKAVTKRLWQQAGLPTSAFIEVPNIEALAQHQLPTFPLFVKPVHEGTSKGITCHSKVDGMEDLLDQINFINTTYHQPALVEEYLTGREFSVGVMGSNSTGRAIGAVEICSATHAFADYHTKSDWSEETFKAVEDKTLTNNICDLALAAYQTVKCQCIGRVDIRLDDQNQPNLIEINPNPALYDKNCSMPIIAKNAGISYPGLFDQIIQDAVVRFQL